MATREGDVEVIREGLTFKRYFTQEGTHPFDQVDWETSDAVIPNYKEGGNAFEQRDVEFPALVVTERDEHRRAEVLPRPLGTPQRESSVRQLVGRVVDTITGWGTEERATSRPSTTRAIFADELTHLLVNQKAAFNSPVWFNVGVADTPQQCSACFILAVDDHMSSILNWYVEEGTIFKGGSGSGINLSKLRSSKEGLAGGGTASGPVSFMRGADASAGTIKSGGKTRRAAKMVILNVDHPDVRDFIWCKATEEKKARALRDAGFDMDLDGRDSYSIQYQNANNSVRVTDEFMQAVLERPRLEAQGCQPTGETLETTRARDLMREIAQAAWECADPGMQYDTTINEWHTCPASGRINASNPCSEYMHLDNSACNLASLNLMKFLDADGNFDVRELPARSRDRVHRPGDRRRGVRLPDREDRRERPGLPPARARLREPRRAADGARSSLRLRPGPRMGGSHHSDHDGLGLPHQRADRGSDRTVRGLRAQRRRDAPRHAQAPRGGGPDRRRARARGDALRGEAVLGRGDRARASSTGTATLRRACWLPPARSV